MFPKLPSTTTTSVTVLLFAIICKTFFSRGKHFREITPQSLNLLVECTDQWYQLWILFNQSGNSPKKCRTNFITFFRAIRLVLVMVRD